MNKGKQSFQNKMRSKRVFFTKINIRHGDVISPNIIVAVIVRE